MRIDPKEYILSINERSALRRALRAAIASQQQRMNRLKRPEAIEDCADNIAKWSDLAQLFAD